MFNETLLIKPKVSTSDLNKMEQTLQARFGKVAKKFGKGLLAGLSGGAIGGAILGFVDKLLNPLKEAQDAINRTIKDADDMVTNAKQFNTTAGKLARLSGLAESTGLDAGSLDVLINKFQNAVAEAEQDPKKDTAVRQYARVAKSVDPVTGQKNFGPEQDIAEEFFKFIQSLQKLSKSQQLLAQQDVFGEKQILKMADFLQSDFGALAKQLGGPSSEKLTKSYNTLGDLNDYSDLLGARRRLNDVPRKARVVNKSQIDQMDSAAKLELERENKRIASYSDLAKINEAAEKISGFVEDGVAKIGTLIDKIGNISATISDFTTKVTNSRLFKMGGSFFGGGK